MSQSSQMFSDPSMNKYFSTLSQKAQEKVRQSGITFHTESELRSYVENMSN
ncbi:MAG: hypothetical protein LBL93_06230 [Ruminococcus sp.]|jgi:hypothetical protein|nr:hypothetical protein [Ruminococcus sp.]